MNPTAWLRERRAAVDRALERRLPSSDGPAARVAEAMRYALLAGGKRLRPILAHACCEACGGSADAVEDAAVAIELLHTYSLIHDDLPAMDDDDLRRGRPTVHRAFDEATAILAGDALHTLAFELLATRPPGDEHAVARAAASAVLARAAGVDGMVGGQTADLEAEGRPVDAALLEWIHRHKTGRLLAASCEIGAIHGGAGLPVRSAFATFGAELGLAFQIADDLLDRTASAGTLGKTPGKDAAAGKATYPALYGLDESRARAAAAARRALDSLETVGMRTEALEALAHYAVTREA